ENEPALSLMLRLMGTITANAVRWILRNVVKRLQASLLKTVRGFIVHSLLIVVPSTASTPRTVSTGEEGEKKAQKMVFPGSHPLYPNLPKGLREVCRERFGDAEISGKRHEDLLQMLSECDDFRSQKTILEEQAEARGDVVVYGVKFHPELAPIEAAYRSIAKSLRVSNTSGSSRGFVERVEAAQGAEDLTITLIRKHFRSAREYLQHYREGKTMEEIEKLRAQKRKHRGAAPGLRVSPERSQKGKLGRLVSDLFLAEGFICANQGRNPTFRALDSSLKIGSRRKTSLIDVTFFKGSCSVEDWLVSDDFELGDHAPISFSLTEAQPSFLAGLQTEENVPAGCLNDHNFYKCNWERYRSYPETLKPSYVDSLIYSSKDLIERSESLIARVQEAAIVACPKKRGIPRKMNARPQWFDSELRKKRSELKRAERIQSSYKRMLRAEYRTLIINKKEEFLQRCFTSLEHAHVSEIHKKARGPKPRLIARILEDDETIEQSANRLANHYVGTGASTASNVLGPRYLASHRELSQPSTPANFLVLTSEEVKSLIEKRRKNFSTAPGIDGIRLRHWHESPDWVKAELGKLIGFSFSNAYLPPSWKHSRTIMIDKPKRDRKSVKSLRPIALCSSLSKIAESYVRKQLESSLESISQSGRQHAYLPGKSAIDVISASAHFIKERKRWSIVSLDYSNAFGEISHEAIVNGLKKFDVSTCTRMWISEWLADRTSELNYGSTTVRRVCFDGKGTPQGALLSPFLFIISTDDVGEKVEKFANWLNEVEACEWKCFADDSYLLISWRVGATDEEIRAALKKIIDFTERESAVVNLKLDSSGVTPRRWFY
ncbi:hypothetical protein FOL47_011004, partial [Perkinsus chesapeaki]